MYKVVKNMIQQMASLYHNHQQLYNKSFKGVHLNTVFHMMSELLTVLITLDEVIGQNPNFKLAWSMYKRMSKSIRSDAARYGTDEERMLQFEKLILQIEGFLLDGRIYHVCLSLQLSLQLSRCNSLALTCPPCPRNVELRVARV